MFVQVIQGQVSDADKLEQQFDQWLDEVADGAEGWLGTTAGVTDDGGFIALARFTSEEAARRNSDRPEQGAWWQETARCFDGEPTFHDCTDVRLWLGGGSDDAGFIQVLQGRITDDAELQAVSAEFEAHLPDARPEIIGAILARHGDGGFTEAVYFTSEEEARAGESQEYSPDVQALFDRWEELVEGDVRYFDLPDPWLASP